MPTISSWSSLAAYSAAAAEAKHDDAHAGHGIRVTTSTMPSEHSKHSGASLERLAGQPTPSRTRSLSPGFQVAEKVLY